MAPAALFCLASWLLFLRRFAGLCGRILRAIGDGHTREPARRASSARAKQVRRGFEATASLTPRLSQRLGFEASALTYQGFEVLGRARRPSLAITSGSSVT